ncbi:MAG: lysylphosphatidylglycerol synthase domain-containing protein, partial [Phycisphaerales bacterium]|nr:lysylphosphatidylglycerol synthase domain-containing protein [Phycisphaerales bacterium]
MSRTLLRIIRLLLVIAGVTVVLWAITWHDAVRIPANGSGPAGNVSETVRSIRITDVKPVGSVLMSGVVVPPDATAQSPQVFQFDKEWYRPGILTTFSKASPVLLLTGLILLIGVYPLQATRWWLLMRCRGLNVGWFRTLRLVFIGAFFNFCLPG